ncbi:MAG: formylglycine-generating enzyme family protein [bacterium]
MLNNKRNAALLFGEIIGMLGVAAVLIEAFFIISEISTKRYVAGSVTMSNCPSDMILIPAGEFIMGCYNDDACDNNENPHKRVYLDAFCMDRTEVTQGAYEKEVGYNPSYFKTCGSNCPVERVTWHNAGDYCTRVGKRLPTEAEWEKAARGTDGRTFPWGNAPPDCEKNTRANYACYKWRKDRRRKDSVFKMDGYAFTAPVGSFPSGASPYGVLDMAGNVWEWVQDCYDNDWFFWMPKRNPVNKISGCGLRVMRGGSWFCPVPLMRVSMRGGAVLGNDGSNDGFRCARDL